MIRATTNADQGHHRDAAHVDHDLVAIAEWMPGSQLTGEPPDGLDGGRIDRRYWRCRKCGQERARREAFAARCPVDRLESPVTEGGYSVEDPRTRRALTEDMTVCFAACGGHYRVVTASGTTYRVDVQAGRCSCPDHTRRGVVCKHQRRVDLEIRAGLVPGPDGTFRRCGGLSAPDGCGARPRGRPDQKDGDDT